MNGILPFFFRFGMKFSSLDINYNRHLVENRPTAQSKLNW